VRAATTVRALPGRWRFPVMVAAAVLAIPPVAGPAAADPGGDVPSRQEVRDARDAAELAERDVAAVQAELAAANEQLRASATAAAQAAEAWNGARYRAQQARQAAAAAADRVAIAGDDVDSQQAAYADALVSSYEMAPSLTAMSSMVQADGITTVVEQATTMQAAESALDSRYDGFRAAATLAQVASDQAEQAEAEASAAQVEAREARDAAAAAADAAAAEAQQVAQRKDSLIAELAALQDTSVELAEQRQAALEEQAAQEAAAAAEAAAQQQAQEQAEQQDQQEEQQAPAPQPAAPSTPSAPAQPASPPPAPPTPPAPSGGASAAVSFARAQLGEPYRWGAAGPDAWDCSGLTMGAWNAGGKALPHYSVAQYEQSSPISPSSLQAGDLVFWGSSSSPSSIYHVALYIGGGQIIHAPRTGRPVVQESMYYWTTPNFYARP
jgi:cell wall-associated NlpC family hydrolase